VVGFVVGVVVAVVVFDGGAAIGDCFSGDPCLSFADLAPALVAGSPVTSASGSNFF